jgi:hypothetical protein
MSSPKLTIFSAPKPFKDPHISTIQYNAIQSWKKLGSDVEVILIGDEFGVKEVADELGVHFNGEVKRNTAGTPLISSIFNLGRELNPSPLLAYINADIIIFTDFLETAIHVSNQISQFLLVGQRWDMNIQDRIDFSIGWDAKLKTECQSVGKLHSRGGSDYFVYPRECFQKVPDFAVGRAGWDNWMFYHARKNKWACIDATKSIQIIHQNHDYSHLPPGKKHYRLPESHENVKLAGGLLSIFTLLDTNYEISQEKIKKFPLSWKKFWREIEIFPLINTNQKWLSFIFFSIFHPIKSYYLFRNKIRINLNERKNA